jgi:hypothetical protein
MNLDKKFNFLKYFKRNKILSIIISVFSIGFIVYIMVSVIGYYLTKYIFK